MMEQKGYERAQRVADQTIQAKDCQIRVLTQSLLDAKGNETTLELKITNLDNLLHEERTRSYHLSVEIANLRKDILELHTKVKGCQNAVSASGGS